MLSKNSKQSILIIENNLLNSINNNVLKDKDEGFFGKKFCKVYCK